MSTNDSSRPDASQPEEIDRLFADYVDRLNRGEILDASEIRRAHPDSADELISALEDFEAFGDAAASKGSTKSEGSARSFGDYDIGRELGRGGMGVVYEALERNLDRRVALKVLSAGLMVDSKSVLRFRREARIAGRLQHAGIVSVYATGVEGDTPYIAMEFVEGETLDRILERKRPGNRNSAPAKPSPSETSATVATDAPTIATDSETVAADALTVDTPALETSSPDSATPPRADDESWSPVPSTTEDMDLSYCILMSKTFAKVARALEYAHAQGITHRDLKPSNLILNADGDLRILDFGLAVLEGQEHLTHTGEIVGTPRYMSPEQALAKGIEIDHRTDVYSLGATLFEMLTLTPPFVGRTAQDTLTRIVQDDVRALHKINPRVPRDLETIVLKCLRKEPEQRYQSAAALAEDLESFARGDAITARPQTALEILSRRARRHRGKILAALLFIIVASLGSWFAVQSRRHESEKDDIERQRILAEYDGHVLDAMIAMEQSGALAYRTAFFAFEGAGYDVWGMTSGFEPIDKGELDEDVELQNARQALESATEAVPTRPEAWFQLARLHLAHEELNGARKALDRAIALDFAPALSLKASGFPDPENIAALDEAKKRLAGTWSAEWIEAQSAFDAERWSEAAELYEGLIARQQGKKELFLGSRVETILSAGLAYLRLQNLAKAIERFHTASTLETGAVEPQLFLGAAHLESGDSTEADRVFEAAYKRTPSHSIVQWVSMLYIARYQEWDLGLKWAERFEDEFSKLTWFLAAYPHVGRADEAARLAPRLEELQPNLPLTHFLMSQAYLNAGKFEESAVSARKAIKLHPNSSSGYVLLSAAQNSQGNYFAAYQSLLKAVEVEPKAAAPHFYLGMGYDAQKLHAKAAEHYEIAIQHAGENTRGFFQVDVAHYRLGKALAVQEKFNEARKSFRRAIEIANANGTASWYWISRLARAEVKSDNYVEGIIEYERVLERISDNPAEYANVRRNYLRAVRKVAPNFPTYRSIDAILAEDPNPSPEAIAALFKLFREKASGANLPGRTAYFRARVHESRGEHADAREQLSNARAHDRTRFEPVLALARSQRRSEQPKNAEKTLREFLETRCDSPATVWKLWVDLHLQDLATSPAEIHAAIPCDGDRREHRSSYASAIATHLERIGRGEVIRINCGGKAYTSVDGKLWAADRFYRGGGLFMGGRRDFPDDVAETELDPIFQTERWFDSDEKSGVNSGGYEIPLPRGRYAVTLHFAEIYHTELGKRIFHVELEGRRVLEDYEARRVGFATADSHRFEIEVKDGSLDLDVISHVDNPKISAIEIESL